MDVRVQAARCGGDDLEGRLGRAIAAADPAPPGLELVGGESCRGRTVEAELVVLLGARAPAD